MQLTRGHSGFSIVGDFVRFSSYFCLDTARFTISNQRGSVFFQIDRFRYFVIFVFNRCVTINVL